MTDYIRPSVAARFQTRADFDCPKQAVSYYSYNNNFEVMLRILTMSTVTLLITAGIFLRGRMEGRPPNTEGSRECTAQAVAKND
jgi:hypothetical protein